MYMEKIFKYGSDHPTVDKAIQIAIGKLNNVITKDVRN